MKVESLLNSYLNKSFDWQCNWLVDVSGAYLNVLMLPVGMMKTCLGDYTMVGDSCYKFYNESATYTKATSRCQGDGATLVSVTNELENKNVKDSGGMFGGNS